MTHMPRRHFLTALGSAALLANLSAQTRKSRYKQSAMIFNFPPNTKLDDACAVAARLGLSGFDLIDAKDFPTLKKHGLICSLYHNNANTFEDGVIRPGVEQAQEKMLHADIDLAAANGVPNVIIVGGQKKGMSPEEGMDRTVAFLNKVKAHAEDKQVTIVLEPVNPVDRPDQLFNRLGLTFEICKRVNSPRVKVLFDIYHAQKIDGDVTRNIRENFQWIGHFHTAGVPARREIDDTQELNYHYIAQTIADLNYTGYIAHEYRPSPDRDYVKSLEQAVKIMTV